MRAMRSLVLLAMFATLSGCASTGATFRSGVADRFLEHAPYYAGVRAAGSGQFGHLPIQYQRGGSQSAMFDPTGGAGTPVAALLAEMNAYLDSLGATVRITGFPPGTPPDVHFGCETDATGDCTNGPAAPFEPGKPRMRLAVGRPSQSWTAALREPMTSAGVERVLLITLEVGQYWPRQRNWRGSKEVELGTRYAVDLPWLTSLETPVSVLQLTGAIIGPDGRAERIGAEGMLARRTPLLASALGAQALITDDDVLQLRSLHRDDLPGRPLVWQVALRNLVGYLTGLPQLTGM